MENFEFSEYGAVAEWSKALALGANPKGRGFKPHRRHFMGHIRIVFFYLLCVNMLNVEGFFLNAHITISNNYDEP